MFKNLFEDSVTKSYDQVLTVKGKIPSWLQGNLFRIGPGKYQAGVCSLLHWFDGFSHIVRLSFNSGKIRYKNAFLQTAALLESQKKKRNAGYMFGSVPTTLKYYLYGVVNVLSSALFLPVKLPNFYDNCNVNIIPSENGNMLALTEVTKYVEFDEEINTLGHYKYKDSIPGIGTTAHPFIADETVYNILQSFSLISTLRIVSHKVKEGRRKIIAKFWRFFPAYFHSFFSSKNYVVLAEPPLRLLCPLLVVLFPFIPFLKFFFWVPFMRTKITVVSKETGKVVLVKKIEPCFFFHSTNAYEKKDGTLVIEFPSFKNPEVMRKHFYLDNIKKNIALNSGNASYVQYAINLNNKTITKKVLADNFFIELQSVAGKYKYNQHRYLFGIGNNFMYPATQAANLKAKKTGSARSVNNSSNENIAKKYYLEQYFQKLLKIDVNTAKVSTFYDEDCYYGEPILVQPPLKPPVKAKAPKGKSISNKPQEDSGILLSLCFSSKTKKSSLIGIDAKTMKKVFEAVLPHVVPLGFHGHFLPSR